MTTQADPLPLAARLWVYQGERFPVFKHGLLIAAFASSAVCLSALLSGSQRFPPWPAFAVAFGVLLTLFLLLRIADEFKDAEVDARYRPERPVPRGLVSLRELAGLGVAAAGLQVLLVLGHAAGLLLILAAVWAYLALMTKEFFVPDWLRQRPFLYMASHMLIMPLIDLFATACEWWPAGGPPPGLPCFLALSFCNGVIIEIGRKTWAPEMEKEGVESYSSAWGIPRALAAWSLAIGVALALALLVARQIDFLLPAVCVLGGLAGAMLATALVFRRQPTVQATRRLENLAGLWVFASYLVLGAVPMGVRTWM